MSTPTSPPSNASPTQLNGRPIQRAPSPTSKAVCKTTFIDESYSTKPGLPIWMAGKRQHGKRQNASEKSRMWALPRIIKTIHSGLVATISSTKVPIPHAMDVDATTTSRIPVPPLKKLTDEERKKLSAEG